MSAGKPFLRGIPTRFGQIRSDQLVKVYNIKIEVDKEIPYKFLEGPRLVRALYIRSVRSGADDPWQERCHKF